MKYYYFGYGMNTNRASMASLCPAAVPLGAAMLEDFEFRFAYHADVVKCSGAKTVGVLWEITDACLARLDIVEGYPSYYERVSAKVIHRDTVYDSLVYVMRPGHELAAPADHYWKMLIEGYTDFDVSKRQLYTALERSSSKTGTKTVLN